MTFDRIGSRQKTGHADKQKLLVIRCFSDNKVTSNILKKTNRPRFFNQ